MTDPMELVGRLGEMSRVGFGYDLTDADKSALTEAAACIREMVAFVPPISLDGQNLPNEHRVWLARQLLDSKLTDDEAFSIARSFPPAPGAEDE